MDQRSKLLRALAYAVAVVLAVVASAVVWTVVDGWGYSLVSSGVAAAVVLAGSVDLTLRCRRDLATAHDSWARVRAVVARVGLEGVIIFCCLGLLLEIARLV